MKKIFLNLLIIFTALQSSVYAAQPDLMSGSRESKIRIVVNNRILAKINGKLISTHDVMKKLDMLFLQQFPEYINSPRARFQFYQANWRSVLDELVNKELILADAEENKVEISNGDVRQEMESAFGPNIVGNLSKIGMSFDEASEILKGELILQRMVAQRVHSRALRLSTPNKYRQAYEEFLQNPNNCCPTIWRYQVLTIREKNPNKASNIANASFRCLIEEGIPFDQLPKTLTDRNIAGRKCKITLSEDFNNDEKDLSDSHKDALLGLNSGMYTQPILQQARNSSDTIYRIFYVKEKIPGGFPSYKEMEPLLKEKVMGQIIDEETEKYIKRLRDHFHLRENDLKALLPEDYEPFVLKQ